jgi:hypothetical protein
MMVQDFCTMAPGFTLGLIFGLTLFYFFFRRRKVHVDDNNGGDKVQTTFDVIKSRRTISPKNFNGEKLNEKEVALILEAANWAPTHKKTEPW